MKDAREKYGYAIVVTGTGLLLVEDVPQNIKSDTVRVGKNVLDAFHNLGGLVLQFYYYYHYHYFIGNGLGFSSFISYSFPPLFGSWLFGFSYRLVYFSLLLASLRSFPGCYFLIFFFLLCPDSFLSIWL